MRRRDRITLGFGCAALVASVLAIGGALRWTQALVAVLVALGLLTQIASRRRLDRTSPIVLLILIAIGLTVIQLVPLPVGVLHSLDAPGVDLRADSAALAGTSVWPAITLDASGTLRALAFLVTLLGVALLGLRIATTERGRYYIIAGVAVTAGLAAAVTGLHILLNLDALYGIYEPHHATPPILGPLLNANHLGGLMALGAVLALGLAFYEPQAPELRVLWVVSGIGCVITCLATLSRGAVLALGLGVVFEIGLLLAARLAPRNGESLAIRRSLRNEIPITIVIAIGLGLAVYTSAGKVADQLENTSLTELNQPVSKFEAWKSSVKLIEDAPWTGVGRGALEPAFTRVHEPSAYVTFSHLENEYIQAVVEWGIPGAAVLGLVLAWCVRVAIRRWRDGALAAAALGGCAAVMFQSSVDFGVELLGLAVPITLVATTVLVVPLREQRNKIGATLQRGSLIIALVGCAALLMLPITRSVQEDHDMLVDQVDANSATLAQTMEVMQRHPLDYLAFGQASSLMMVQGDNRAARFLNHALELHPSHPGLHRLAARMLVATSRRSQASIEYALALHGTLAPGKLIKEILTLMPDAGDAAASIPPDYANVELVVHLLHDAKRDDVAEAWLIRVVELPQHDTDPIDMLYDLALARKHLPIAEHAARLRIAFGRTASARVKLAKVMFQERRFDQILTDLADVASWTGRIDEQADAWFIVCDVYIERRQWDPALQCLHKIDGSGILISGRREGITKRLTIISDQRTHEAKLQAIEAMERALGSH